MVHYFVIITWVTYWGSCCASQVSSRPTMFERDRMWRCCVSRGWEDPLVVLAERLVLLFARCCLHTYSAIVAEVGRSLSPAATFRLERDSPPNIFVIQKFDYIMYAKSNSYVQICIRKTLLIVKFNEYFYFILFFNMLMIINIFT